MWRLHLASSFRRMTRRLSDDVPLRGKLGPNDGREKMLTGKWEGGGDGNMNENEDRNGHNGRYEGMNGSGNRGNFREDQGENGDPGNLRNDSRGEVEYARESVTPTGNQQPLAQN